MGLWNAGEYEAYVLVRVLLRPVAANAILKWLCSLSTVTIVDFLKWTFISVGKWD